MQIPSSRRIQHLVIGLLGFYVATSACSSSNGNDGNNGSGGAPPSGGTTSTTGGASSGSTAGGSTSTGGTKATGGSTSTGGTKATGGTTSATAPTWTQIYANYFASGTAGRCVNCHTFGATKSSLYSDLQSSGQIDGTNSLIVKNGSILTWFGGTMPKGGTATNAAAVADLKAWVAAGALNN